MDRPCLAVGQVDELPGVGRDRLDGKPDVLGPGLHVADDVAHGVGAVFLDDVFRVDAVALALAHPLALAVLDVGVDEAVGEGDVAEEVEPHELHPGDPEGDDVAGRDQAGARVVVAQAIRRGRRRRPRGRWPGSSSAVAGIGPAERAERPEGRAEPGVEDVGILLEAGRFEPRRVLLLGPASLRRDEQVVAAGLRPVEATSLRSQRKAGLRSSAIQAQSPGSPALGSDRDGPASSAPARLACQIGMRWPHQSWRLMHQSRFSASQLVYVPP